MNIPLINTKGEGIYLNLGMIVIPKSVAYSAKKFNWALWVATNKSGSVSVNGISNLRFF